MTQFHNCSSCEVTLIICDCGRLICPRCEAPCDDCGEDGNVKESLSELFGEDKYNWNKI